MTKIKICGLQRLCDIDYVNQAKPDYAGFVFAKSKRQITKEHAVTLRHNLAGGIPAVGVFVDELPAIAASYAESGIIDLIQLHGREDANYINRLRQYTGCDIIQAFAIHSVDDIMRAAESPADYILLDNQTAGSGQAFDWRLIEDMDRPYFLAGGLNIENVNTAVQTLKPYAIDISSGVETDGFKDQQKIASCIRRIRNV